MASPKVFRATLPHPVGVNRTYRIGYNRKTRKYTFIKSKKAGSWEDAALIVLKGSGFTQQPEGMYWCSIHLTLYTSRLDIDSPIKATLDLIMKALSREELRGNTKKVYSGVEDRFNGELVVHKVFVTPQAEQRLEVEVEVWPIKTKKEFNQHTQRRKREWKPVTG